jgi:hypothetical protein
MDLALAIGFFLNVAILTASTIVCSLQDLGIIRGD